MIVCTVHVQAASDVARRGGVTEEDDEQLRTRIAWLYHVEGLTQAQIARRLGQNRVKVLRMLAAARDDGLVQVRINARLADCVAAERSLERGLGLDEAVVVPTPAAPAAVSEVVGLALGAWLGDRLKSGQTIGVGWGRTLQASLRAIARRGWRDQTVVSLLGGLTRAHPASPFEFAWRFSNLLGADCYYVAAPVYTSDPATRDSLMAQRGLHDLFARARRADLAVVSVGAMDAHATIPDLGLIGRSDLASLRKAGAVGDLLGHYLGADGGMVAHPLNRCVMALAPGDLARLPHVVVASGGVEKAAIIRAALKVSRARTLITDLRTAQRLVA
jgi:DNA-binding transcriptional regulator LsrR (DeoR family)